MKFYALTLHLPQAPMRFVIVELNLFLLTVISLPGIWIQDFLRKNLTLVLKRGRLPKAAIVVDIYGQCADYDPIVETCGKYGIPIVEDAAEALGVTYNGTFAGKFGVMGVFSFNGNKIVTTSGGGMLVSDNEEYIRQASFLSTQARDPAPHYQHSHIGYNYRLSNLLAAVGRGQLEKLEEKVAKEKDQRILSKSTLGSSGH